MRTLRRTNWLLGHTRNLSVSHYATWLVLAIVIQTLVGAFALGVAQWHFQSTLGVDRDWPTLLYHSFLSFFGVLDGKFQPIGLARVIFAAQVTFGTFLLAVSVAFLIAKLQTPDKNTLLFSDVAILLTKEKKLALLAVNTSLEPLTNIVFTSVVRYYRRHSQPQAFHLPYLDRSVLLLKLNEFDMDSIDPKDYDPNQDGLKLAISCNAEFAIFTASRKYLFEKILVIEDQSFMDRPLFESPKFESDEFWAAFHLPVSSASTLHDTINSRRK